jgi:hypothetical protein
LADEKKRDTHLTSSGFVFLKILLSSPSSVKQMNRILKKQNNLGAL